MDGLNNFLIVAHRVCDYIPGIATVSNLVVMFQKYAVLPHLEEETILNNRYFTYISETHGRDLTIGSVPGLGQIGAMSRWGTDRIIRITNAAFECLPHTNKANVIAVIESSPRAFKAASNKLQNDKDVVLAFVKRWPDKFSQVGESFRGDKEIMLAAVKGNGKNLQFASDELKNDREVVSASIENDPGAFKYASKDVKNDEPFLRKLLEKDPLNLLLFSDKFKSDDAVGRLFMDQVLNKLKNQKNLASNPQILDDCFDAVGTNLKNDPVFVKEILDSGFPDIMNHVSNDFKDKNPDLVRLALDMKLNKPRS